MWGLMSTPQMSRHDAPMVKKIAVERAGRAARQAERRRVGPLKENVILPVTLKRYALALNMVYAWMVDVRGILPTSAVELDACLSEYIECLWDEGESKSLATNTLAAMQHYLPWTRRQLYGSWRLITAWQKHEMPAQAAPFTPEILWAFSGAFASWGYVRMSVLLILAFSTFMRTGELFVLRRKDLLFKEDLSSLVISLSESKGISRRGGHEFLSVEDPLVVLITFGAFGKLLPGDQLADMKCDHFRRLFRRAVVFYNLDHFKYTPYSLRRGGATWDFRLHGQMSRTLVKGRWANERTARLYLQESLALLSNIMLTEDVQERLRVGSMLWKRHASKLIRSARPEGNAWKEAAMQQFVPCSPRFSAQAPVAERITSGSQVY